MAKLAIYCLTVDLMNCLIDLLLDVLALYHLKVRRLSEAKCQHLGIGSLKSYCQKHWHCNLNPTEMEILFVTCHSERSEESVFISTNNIDSSFLGMTGWLNKKIEMESGTSRTKERLRLFC